MRHRIAVEAPQDSSDGAGGTLRVWQRIATVWGEVAPGRIRPGERFDAREAPLALRVRLRWRADVGRGMALVLPGGRRLRVLAAHDPDERRRLLVLDCVEEG